MARQAAKDVSEAAGNLRDSLRRQAAVQVPVIELESESEIYHVRASCQEDVDSEECKVDN